jgi:DNA-binding response OmpR family regulator
VSERVFVLIENQHDDREGGSSMQQMKRQSSANSMAKTILVVEDDDSIGSLLIEALSQETPYRAMLVTDGLQALNVIQSIKPCLLITDYSLPYMNGIEFYDRVREQTELSDVPTILISARMPENEVCKRQLTSLRKPFELDDLLNTVERLLEDERYTDDLLYQS